MRAGWEELGYAGCFQPRFCEADSCAEAGTAGSYYYCIVVVVDYGVGGYGGAGGCRGSSSLSLREEGSMLRGGRGERASSS